jgi:D-glycero-D-manno-heptose 1,7-bisphosphate phosphatase
MILSMRPALFLDRDGVIIENRPAYVRSWEEVEIYPQALAALASLRSSPYQIVIVTNQSGVGRGVIPLKTAERINRRLVKAIQAAGGRVDGVYLCPHTPMAQCECRKPKPGLLLQAAREMGLDLGRSLMVGDALTDVLAGRAAGVGQAVMVRTGRGAAQLELPGCAELSPFPIYDTLADVITSLAVG